MPIYSWLSSASDWCLTGPFRQARLQKLVALFSLPMKMMHVSCVGRGELLINHAITNAGMHGTLVYDTSASGQIFMDDNPHVARHGGMSSSYRPSLQHSGDLKSQRNVGGKQ